MKSWKVPETIADHIEGNRRFISDAELMKVSDKVRADVAERPTKVHSG